MNPITNDFALGESFDALKSLWRNRNFTLYLFGRQISQISIKGKTFYLEHELPGIILDTIGTVWPEPRPRLLLTQRDNAILEVISGCHALDTEITIYLL